MSNGESLNFDVKPAPYYFRCVSETKYSRAEVSLDDKYQSWPGNAPAPYFSPQRRYVEGYRSSIIGNLLEKAQEASLLFPVPIWHMLECILTGEMPPVPSIDILGSPVRNLMRKNDGWQAFTSQGIATLRVMPWTRADDLAAVWREYQVKANIAHQYAPTEKQEPILDFVLKHTVSGDEFAWEKLAQKWNESQNQSCQRNHPKTRKIRPQIYNDFKRAREAIFPNYLEEDEADKEERFMLMAQFLRNLVFPSDETSC